MLPLIPIGAAILSAAVLIKNKLKSNAKKASYSKLLDYVKTLYIPVDSDGNFNPDAQLPDGTPILFDIMFNTELFTALLDYGANPNICDANGVPAIVYAVMHSYSEQLIPILTLLKYGANPNAMDSEGKTAVFHTNSVNILKQLKDAGADLNAVDCAGKSALFYSFANNTTKGLIELGADVNLKDADGRTAAFYISGEKDMILVKFMEKYGLDLSIKDNNGISFNDLHHNICVQSELNHEFYLAVNSNNLSEVNRLLERGANPNYCSEAVHDWSMLDEAIYNNNPEMIELLVKHGTDINNINSSVPPLAKAVYDKKFDCFKKLLELGADPSGARLAIKYSGNKKMKKLFEQYNKS